MLNALNQGVVGRQPVDDDHGKDEGIEEDGRDDDHGYVRVGDYAGGRGARNGGRSALGETVGGSQGCQTQKKGYSY